MGIKAWIIPQEKLFFELLRAVSTNLVGGAAALCDLIDDYRNVPEKRRKVKEIEHLGDEAVHEVFEALNRTFVLPFDREDIVALASNMDNVLDEIHASAVRLDLYEVRDPTPSMVKLADVIRDQCERIDQAVDLVRSPRNADRVEGLVVEINRLENTADDLLNNAVAELFRTGDAITIIKLKDIYEHLEMATDYCEDVGDTLSDIAAKYR